MNETFELVEFAANISFGSILMTHSVHLEFKLTQQFIDNLIYFS
jgi:hypothetical protein